MKKVRVDVYDGDKKIGNFEGNISLEDYQRIEGKEEKPLHYKVLECMNSKDFLTPPIPPEMKIAQIAIEDRHERYLKAFDEATIGNLHINYVDRVRTALEKVREEK